MTSTSRLAAVLMGLLAPAAPAAGQLTALLPDPAAAVESAEVPGFTRWFLRDLEPVLQEGLRAGITPGLALVIGEGGRVVFARGYGRTDEGPESAPVTERTLFDLASLTKVAATTVAVMLLVEDGRLDLDAPVSTWLGGWPATGAHGGITLRHLLDHTSGLPEGAPVWRMGDDRAARIGVLGRLPLHALPGERELYSDLGPILAGWVVEAVTGEPLDVFVDREVYRPLDMTRTRFRPLEAGVPPEEVAPTDLVSGRARAGRYRGVVHDPNARALGGVAGNAGLFASAEDLAVLASALLWERPLRLVCRDVLRDFTRRTDRGTRFAAGWERPARWSFWSEVLGDGAFGHGGFTGTTLWIDPARDVFVVLLTSRLAGQATEDDYRRFRRDVFEAVRRGVLRPERPMEGEWRLHLDEWRSPDGCRGERGGALLAELPFGLLVPRG